MRGSIFASLMFVATLALADDARFGCHNGFHVLWSKYEDQVWAYNPPNSRILIATKLIMQKDGNLVLYGYQRGYEKALWASATNGSGANVAVFQCDGNLVVYNGTKAVWAASRTPGFQFGGNQLSVQMDGNLVIYDTTNPRNRRVMWTANSQQ